MTKVLKWLGKSGLVLGLALSLSGCIPNVEKLCALQQSACFNVSTVYGTLRGACSGLLNGEIKCDQDGMSIKAKEPVK